ncbi:MAG: hypothetical protein FWG61_01570 [Firmicutes bacterium]|nr:hypothetical protein [Bacillota bacterium]
MKKRITLLTLSLLLFFGLVPMTASANTSSVTVVAISSGTYHCLAIKNDGSLWAWGSATYIGDGTLEDRLTPVKIMDNVAVASTSGSHSMAIKKDGSLWTWGVNGWGQLGRASDKNDYTPMKIMDGVSAISAGALHSLAIKNDGSLWAWGYNDSGQLGDGTLGDTYEFRITPVKIMDDVKAISAGRYHSLAIKNDGSLWAWGSNYSGSIGDGTLENQPVPVKIMENVTAASASSHNLALKSDGSLWAWGFNRWGTIGDGTTEERLIPVKVMDDVLAFSAGDNHSLAIKNDGSLWAWGSNYLGSLGDGTEEDRLQPVQIMDNSIMVSAGSWFSLAVKKDGSLWAWGNNSYGQIGDGTKITRNIHFKIMDGIMLPGTSAPSPPSSPVTQPPNLSLTAKPTAAIVLVNGKNVAFDAYNIEGNNYFKLRDLACTLSGTEKQFEVGFDSASNTIVLANGKPYTIIGGEMSGKGVEDKTTIPTNSKIYLDGKEVQFIAYNIDGNNYFKLRDIGQALDFGVGWDASSNTITIDTTTVYKE